MEYNIYKIICKVNNKEYYGRSQEVEKRFRAHKNMLRSNTHRNMYMQEDWNKYGEEMFEFIIIETFKTLEESIKSEQNYIDKNIGVGYNIGGSKDGGDRMKYNPRKEETRKLKQKIFSGENNPMYGKEKTDKMINSVKEANSKPIEIDGKKYKSITEASDVIGVKKTTIIYRLDSKNFKTYKRL